MRWLLTLSLGIAVGCSSSHVEPGADSGAPFVDGGPGAGDAGPLGTDAGPPGLAFCALDRGESLGEPCFCNGATALFGDTLYRLSVGVEIWDVSRPLVPVRVGTIDERPVSHGGLAVTNGHLLTVGNFDEGLGVYALEDPHAPREIARLPIADLSPIAIAAAPDFAVLHDEGPEQRLIGIDLISMSAPRIAYTVPVEGRVTDAVVGGASGFDVDGRLYVSTRDSAPERGWLEVRELRTGALLERHLMEEGEAASYFGGIALHHGRVLRTTGDALQVLELRGGPPVEVGRFATGDDRPIAVTVHDDLAVIGGSAMFVLDVSDPTAPRELGRAALALGDTRAIVADADVAFISNGNGLMPIALRCE